MKEQQQQQRQLKVISLHFILLQLIDSLYANKQYLIILIKERMETYNHNHLVIKQKYSEEEAEAATTTKSIKYKYLYRNFLCFFFFYGNYADLAMASLTQQFSLFEQSRNHNAAVYILDLDLGFIEYGKYITV